MVEPGRTPSAAPSRGAPCPVGGSVAAARPIASVCASPGGANQPHGPSDDGRLEDGTPVDDRRGAIHAKPDTFNDGGLVPRVNYPPIDGGLPANSFEAGTPEPGRFEGVPGEQRVEARDGPGERARVHPRYR